MKELTYAQQTIDSPNPVARFAHRKRAGISVKLSQNIASKGGSVLDFGAGTGLFLKSLKDVRPDLHLIGYEPFMASEYLDVDLVSTLESVESKSIDLVTAFEVCEHLTNEELQEFIEISRRVLKTNGYLFVSVPIMYGGAALPKVTNWMLRSRSLRVGYSASDIVKSTFGFRIPQPTHRRDTHKGFDFRILRRMIDGRFKILDERYSPFPFAPWFCNSQCFMLFKGEA